MNTGTTKDDQVRAAGMGVQIDCPNCAAAREMDDCHRIQIGILRDDAISDHRRYANSIREVCTELGRQARLKDHWKLGCFAGWFTVALFIIGEMFNK